MRQPPEQAVPDDCARYGWRNNIWDKPTALEKSAVGAAVQAWFDSEGWTFASELLGYFMGNNKEGFVYDLNPRFEFLDELMATDDVKFGVQKGLDSIKRQAVENVRRDPSLFNIKQEINGKFVNPPSMDENEWRVTYPTDSPDVTYALGHFSTAVVSDTVVNRPIGNGEVTAEIVYDVYFYDYYYYHLSEGRLGGFATDFKHSMALNADEDMRWLEEAGWARSFRVKGNTYGGVWKGVVA
ncbi:hypothetical protein Srot_2467 [Segniliparus rotundus DSM 44985]|uniref:Uncharacterized protein n=1 Tax=Segniliparus rotundus (strain ATCC BAA-972 / CDC 1076 / CIP 108378 / DSM 44985 / JCM 13578) TaxID=640132 RepID=D6ZBF5_SEGRD|nr:hypothetical protein [Segniliparus rotundus]ADG98907.1 hypothetical protein Srot_2467 [Segniliparus rotundus DSM 44985]